MAKRGAFPCAHGYLLDGLVQYNGISLVSRVKVTLEQRESGFLFENNEGRFRKIVDMSGARKDD